MARKIVFKPVNRIRPGDEVVNRGKVQAVQHQISGVLVRVEIYFEDKTTMYEMHVVGWRFHKIPIYQKESLLQAVKSWFSRD